MRQNGDISVVLVPGFMADEDLWRDMIADVETLGPVIHADLGKGETIDAMARNVINACPPRFMLIGFSMGGYIVREIARLVPERVAALVLIATSSRAYSRQQSERRAAGARAIPAGLFKGLSRSAIRASLHPQYSGDERMIARIRDMGVRLGYQVFIRQAMLARETDRDRLNLISCPTLVIAAAQDQLRSVDESSELCEGMPNATLKVIEDSGHMLPIEQPGAVAETIIAWFAKIDKVT